EHEADEGSPWTTVKHRRARSLDSLNRDENSEYRMYSIPKTLSSEQRKVVRVATDSLTPEERAKITKRQEIIELEKESREASRLATNKGKTTDPREWGNVSLDEEEITPETQEAILQSHKAKSKKGKSGKSKN
ncbi:hypothetical protein BYT27DRAFT_7003431, partial [Phlegmacium glaucopus]